MSKRGLEEISEIEQDSTVLPNLSFAMNRFVMLIVEGYIPTEAYIQAYNCQGKRATAYVEASKLLKHPKITPWLEYYKNVKKEHIEKEIKYSIDDAFNEFEEMKIIALESKDQYGRPNVQAANKAIEIKCKLKGLMNDDVNLNNSITMKMGDVEIDGVALQYNIGDDINGNTENSETTENT